MLLGGLVHRLVGGGAMVLFLGDARCLAAPSAQVIELGAAYLSAAHDPDGIDHGRIERENALHTFAIGDLAHREILVEARASAPDADAFVGLDAGTLALDHLVVDEDGIARGEVRDVLACGELGNLLLLELLNEVHGNASVGGAVRTTRAFPADGVGRASTPPRGFCHPAVTFAAHGGRDRRPTGRGAARGAGDRPEHAARLRSWHGRRWSAAPGWVAPPT